MLNQIPRQIALVTGVTGQDGILISRILLSKGYKVIGLTRSLPIALKKLKQLKIINEINLIETNYSTESLVNILNLSSPSLIINLAGQSYVSRSWEIIEETIFSQGVITCNILDAIVRSSKGKIKFINSTSSEIFDTKLTPPYNEVSVRRPYNPYGSAQILSSGMVEIFRERYGLFACNAIFFPHESIYRGKNFFFTRIINEIEKIASGQVDFLEVGNLKTIRDWGCAREYMEGVYSMAELDAPEDFCFSTNRPYSVEQILEIAFSKKQLNYKKYIRESEFLKRHYEPIIIYGDSSKASKLLKWYPTLWGESLVERLFFDFGKAKHS